MSQEKVIAGIDLGTRKTRVAIKDPEVDDKLVKYKGHKLVESDTGKVWLPSVVSFTEDGEVIVGDMALTQIPINPKRTVHGIKRIIGLKQGDPGVKEFCESVNYKISFDDDGLPYIEIPDDDKKYRPEEIIAMILKEINRMVRRDKGHGIDECAITVPADFNDSQRRAVMVAAELAGLNCLKLVNETHAAAYGLPLDIFKDQKILICDIGAGKIEVSIIKEEEPMSLLATAGDSSFGGNDIDSLLVEEMLERFMKKNPSSNPRQNLRSVEMLRQQCENAKIFLSKTNMDRIEVQNFADEKDLFERLTITEFNSLCECLAEKVINLIDTVLYNAGLQTEDIDNILMIGRSSEIPLIREAISDYFDGKEIGSPICYDQSVPIGAAIMCEIISNEN